MDSPTTLQRVTSIFGKPVLAGIAAAVGTYMVLGEGGTTTAFPLIGNVNTIVGVSGIVAASTLIGELSKDFVLEKIPNNRYFEFEAKIASPVLAGAITTAILYNDLDNGALWKAFSLGSLSEVVGSYA